MTAVPFRIHLKRRQRDLWCNLEASQSTSASGKFSSPLPSRRLKCWLQVRRVAGGLLRNGVRAKARRRRWQPMAGNSVGAQVVREEAREDEQVACDRRERSWCALRYRQASEARLFPLRTTRASFISGPIAADLSLYREFHAFALRTRCLRNG